MRLVWVMETRRPERLIVGGMICMVACLCGIDSGQGGGSLFVHGKDGRYGTHACIEMERAHDED